MKRIFASWKLRAAALLLTAFCLLPPALFGQGTAGPVLGGTNYSNLSSAFTIPSVSWAATGLTLNYTAGTVYQAGNATAITANTLTMTTNLGTCTQAGIQAGSCNIVYWASGASLSTTTTYATAAAAGNRILYFVATNSSGNITGAWPVELDTYGPVPPTYGDGVVIVPPSACWMTPSTTSFTSGPVLTRAAANNQVLSATANTTAGTIYVDCDFSFEGRTTAGLGFQAKSVSLLYGIQGAAMTSIAAATVDTITYPSPGGSASGTVAATGAPLTVTPTTLQTATTTAGQCYDENIAFGTPFTVTNQTRLIAEQAFSNSTTATTLQVCGVLVYGNWIQ
jgi:hypothetical protein